MLRSHVLIAGMTVASLASSAAGCSGSEVTTSGGAAGGAAGQGTGSSASSVGSSSASSSTSSASSSASSSSASTSSASSSSGGGPTGGHAEPPAPPPQHSPDGTGDVTFAIKKLYYGDTNRDGTPNKVSGWKQFGYDLDGKISTADSTDLCKPRNNAPPKVTYPDGNDGIDNAFGRNILPFFLGFEADGPTKANDSIANGQITTLLSMAKLGPSSEYNPILTRLYGGANLGNPPLFDGTDLWPVKPEFLLDPQDIKSAKTQFSASYLVNNTWVSGTRGNVEIELPFGGATLRLSLVSAVITMDLDSAHKNAIKGTIAGILPTDSLVIEIKKFVAALNPAFCSGATIDSLVAQVEQASDILQDGLQDPTKNCDGISIGLGFDAAIVQLGGIAAPTPPTPDPCAPMPVLPIAAGRRAATP